MADTEATAAEKDLEQRVELESDLTDFAALVRCARSVRRYDESDPIGRELLLELVNLARLAPNGNNMQQLRFRVVSAPEEREATFACLSWAARLRDWAGPEPGERPTGYVVICAPEPVAPIRALDTGIAAQTMLLAATQAGYGACMIKSFGPGLARALDLPEGMAPQLVLALGKPGERVVLERVDDEHGVAYWRDADGTHHVPKLPLSEVLL